jgi:hypothetical protein
MMNRDNLNNVRCEISRNFSNKKLEDKINELKTNRPKILDTYAEAQMNIRMFTNLKLCVCVCVCVKGEGEFVGSSASNAIGDYIQLSLKE